MTRSRAILGVLTLTMLATGCETLGKTRKEPQVAGLPAGFEPRSPVEGARGLVESARPPGAWSRDAAEIEKSLNRRSADANW